MKIRRKIQDITLGEQDPGKDLFAILFLAFFVILLVQIQLISQKDDRDKVPDPIGGTGEMQVSNESIAFVSKQVGGEIIFTVRENVYSKERFFEELPSLSVMSEEEGISYINLQADNSLGGLEWDNLKVEIKRKGYGINVTVPTK